ncbi:MAG: galactokinase [Rectinemataceae bacterium]
MSDKKESRGRFAGKAARKNLAELYGASGADSAALRYDRLAELVLRDIAANGSSPGSELRFYSAPGRTELGGNHTDHNRGRVLCAAVRLDAVACVTASSDDRVRLLSEGYARPIEVDVSKLEPRPEERGSTESLIRGVARGLADRGVAPRGFVGRVHSLVLPGSGLSSSASIEVLLGTVMADLGGARLSLLDIAKIGQFAENVYFGKPCGLMDQTASAVGGIAEIDFADPSEPLVRRIDYDFEAEGYALVVVNTGGSHADLTADYAAIPAEMRTVAELLGASELRDIDAVQIVARGPEIRSSCGDRAFLRALHFIGDDRRVVRMSEALQADDLGAYLKQVKKSGDSSWRLLQNLYPPENPREQGLPVALALSADFIGRKGAWRVHGGGFAGTIQAYLPRKLLPGYVELMERYFGEGCVLPLVVRRRGAVRVL